MLEYLFKWETEIQMESNHEVKFALKKIIKKAIGSIQDKEYLATNERPKSRYTFPY